MTLYCLAGLAQDQNDSEQAITLYKDSIANYQEAGADRGILSCLEGLASSYAAQGQLERAALLFGAAQAQRDALRYIFYPSNGEEYERSVAETRAALGEAAWTRAWDRGRAMTLNQATDYALDERDLSLTSGV